MFNAMILLRRFYLLRITLLATGAFRPAGCRHSGRDIFRGEDSPCTCEALLFMSLGRGKNRAWRIAPGHQAGPVARR